MIELESLQVDRGGVRVLDLDRWRVEQGEAALVLGPSGSGKTTLLHVLARLLTPASGTVVVAGQDLSRLGSRAADRWRGRTLGIVFQRLLLVRSLDVRGNLRLAQRLAGAPPDPQRIDELIERLGLTGRAHAKARALSTGEAQRAAIARALISKPKLVLADEPTSSLDDANAMAAADLLQNEAARCGATLVVITHDSRLKDRFANRLVLTQDGRRVDGLGGAP